MFLYRLCSNQSATMPHIIDGPDNLSSFKLAIGIMLNWHSLPPGFSFTRKRPF